MKIGEGLFTIHSHCPSKLSYPFFILLGVKVEMAMSQCELAPRKFLQSSRRLVGEGA